MPSRCLTVWVIVRENRAESKDGGISEFGVPAVNHKIACDWEQVGIKSACFKLLRVSSSMIAVFWERKLRAQGFLRKEMRICAVVGCSSSTYQLQKWRKGFCTSHNCHRASQDCACPDLFQLYPFPTLKGDPEKRKEWVKSINRKKP